MVQSYDDFPIIGIAYSRHIAYHKRGTTTFSHHNRSLVIAWVHSVLSFKIVNRIKTNIAIIYTKVKYMLRIRILSLKNLVISNKS